MTLKDKLKRLQQNVNDKSEQDWNDYKTGWVNSITELQDTIKFKWFENYFKDNLMEFATIPIKRFEPNLGEYYTTSLEITLSNNKTLLLEPIAAVTTEFDGKLEFSLLGNVYKKVSILRKLTASQKPEWIIASSYDLKDQRELTQIELENLIDKWLS